MSRVSAAPGWARAAVVVGVLAAGTAGRAQEEPPRVPAPAPAPPVPLAPGDGSGQMQPGTRLLGPPPAVVHREGEYGGVVPGRVPANKRLSRYLRSGSFLTWVGFQPLEAGSSRIFVQMTRDATFEQTLVGDKLVVSIEGVRFATRHARRFVDTGFFDSSVRRIDARAVRPMQSRRGQPERAGSIELVLTFKNPADARPGSARAVTKPDGFHYLYLDFGPASAASPAPEPAAAPAADD
jgi:hypothetical protein